MSKLTTFTALQKQGGEELANSIAEFTEAQQQEAFKSLATKEDVFLAKQEILEEINKSREEAANSEANLIKVIDAKLQTLAALLIAFGVAVALLNVFL